MSSTIGKMSIHVNSRFPRTARQCVQIPRPKSLSGCSLSEPRAVSFLQPQSDLRHHLVHFGVRQGALRTSESQGERDALVTFANLRAAILVERARVLEKFAA